MKESFLMYLSFDEAAKLLNDEDRGKLWSAVFEYAKTGQELPLPLPAKVAFAFIREHLKRDGQKYENICARNAANGRRGGRPKNPENPVGYLGTQNNPDEPRKAQSDSDTDSVSETDTNTVHISESKSEKALTRNKKVFIKPGLQEFLDYCRNDLKDYDLEADNIYRAYDENNWHDSKGNPIRNWKMKLRQVWCTPQSRKKEDPEAVAMRNLITPAPEEAEADIQRLESMGFKL